MKGHRVRACDQVVPLEVFALLVRVVCDKVTELGVAQDDLIVVPPVLELFFTRQFVIRKVREELWMLFNQCFEHFDFIPMSFIEKSVVGLCAVESALSPFCNQVRVDDLVLDTAAVDLGVKL